VPCVSLSRIGRSAIETDRAPLVSVVTPVYNTGEYLEAAIRSVLAQSYSNWEYIICNNHSTDETAEIAARFAASDPRIRVVSPPTFLSQPKNFNFALQQTSPESRYTKLVLADDLLFPDCLTKMVELAETDETIALVCSYRLIETAAAGFGLRLEQNVIPGRVAGRMHLLNGVFLFGTPSAVLYRSSLVRSRSPHFYPEDRYYFDTDVAFQILDGRNFGFVHQVLTYSRYQEESITHRERDLFSGELDMMICLHSYGPAYLSAAEFRRCKARARKHYYERLGREWLLDRFRGRRDDFWQYHEVRLNSAGLHVERRAVLRGALDAVVRALLSPSQVWARITRRRSVPDDPWAI
jgi:glycosyltransferase involved in cell wall biosynthesis